MRIDFFFLLPCLLVGCNSVQATGSQALAASKDGSALYAVNADDQTIIRWGVGDRRVTRAKIGIEPTRVARAGDTLLVSLRGERAVAVVRDTDSELVVEGRIDVGAEPYGIVANRDGSIAFVAASLSNEVEQIDLRSRKVVQRWTILGEPRWLALSMDERFLYVGCAAPIQPRPNGLTNIYTGEPLTDMDGDLSMIDLRSGAVSAIQMPQWPPEQGERSFRITGDLAMTPDDTALLIPGVFVNDQAVLQHEAPPPEEVKLAPSAEQSPRTVKLPQAFNPVLVMAFTFGGGLPGVWSVAPAATTTTAVGYPAGVSSSKDSKTAFVPIEGASTVLAMEIIGAASSGWGPEPIQKHTAVSIETGAGPKTVAVVADDRAFVYNVLDHSVGTIDLGAARSALDAFDSSTDADPVLPKLRTTASTPIADESLADDVALGRRLFYATNNARTSGGNVSCATCHFEGRTDGITWTFDRGKRQTPSLAGPVSLTSPVTWEGDQPTVADEAIRMSRGLMLGSGLTVREAQAIEAFIDAGRDVDVPFKAWVDDRSARGKAIFERADVGCSACHQGPRMTNNAVVSLFGLPRVKVRSLIGIAASPPYLHDGSAPTLRALVDRLREREMGDTSSLSDEEMDDLAFYLSTL
jgi:mono/diheme cytochrome c family protein